MDIKQLIQNKIKEIQNEKDENIYYDNSGHKIWEECRDAKVEILEDVLGDIE